MTRPYLDDPLDIRLDDRDDAPPIRIDGMAYTFSRKHALRIAAYLRERYSYKGMVGTLTHAEVLDLYAKGTSTREVARRAGVSPARMRLVRKRLSQTT